MPGFPRSVQAVYKENIGFESIRKRKNGHSLELYRTEKISLEFEKNIQRQMNATPIFFAFDENMLMPAGVCITSLLESAEKDTFYDIFVLQPSGCDFAATKLARLGEKYGNCRLTFRSVGSDFDGKYEVRGITSTTYYRLAAGELIPEYDKILYSDVDVIFREDQSKYYETDLGGNYVAGVRQLLDFVPDYKKYVTGVFGPDMARGYYYAGNMLLNLAAIRRDGLYGRFIEESFHNYRFQDMDIVNKLCFGKILDLPPAFCLTVENYLLCQRSGVDYMPWSGLERSEALVSGTVHYNGPKPWKEMCFNMDLWWSVYRKSIFYDEAFCLNFYSKATTVLERMSLWKRIKLALRYFRKGGRV